MYYLYVHSVEDEHDALGGMPILVMKDRDAGDVGCHIGGRASLVVFFGVGGVGCWHGFPWNPLNPLNCSPTEQLSITLSLRPILTATGAEDSCHLGMPTRERASQETTKAATDSKNGFQTDKELASMPELDIVFS